MIKKITFSLFVIILGILSESRADILVQTTDVSFAPGTDFTIPIKIYGASEDGTPISSANIVFTFDTAAVKFMGFMNWNPITPQGQWFFSGNNTTGIVAANWLEPNLLTVSLPDGSTLYEVKFKAKPGTTAFHFITYEFTDALYNIIPTSTDDGSYASLQQVTFLVDMRDQFVSPSGVHVSGTFNGWSETATPMSLSYESVYSATVQVLADSAYYYLYVNGTDTAGYESAPAGCTVPYGNTYARTFEVPAADTTLAEVCFASCDTCPPQVPVTFRVDMSQQTISQNGIHLAGSFNNWDPSATVMSNLGNSIFGVTLMMTPDIIVDYRFVNGNTTSGYEIVPANCGVPAGGGLYNRQITVPQSDTTLVAVCFSNCEECLTLRSVTFKVDMQDQTISTNGVHLAGSFNSFNTNSIPMTNQGNNVFIVSVDLLQNEFDTYRFVNGNDPSGFETVPAECGIDNGSGVFNRYLTVPAQDTILDEICFNSCSDCTQQPFETDVTFNVDMSFESISPDGIYLAGTFNSWNLSANPMIETGNNIYSTTLTLNENDVHNYLFVNGNNTSGYETVPPECGVTGTTGSLERQITVPVSDTTLEPLCFGYCILCPIGILEVPVTSFGTFYPNPARDQFRIPVNAPDPMKISIEVFNPTGACSIAESYSLDRGQHDLMISTAGLPDGLYFIRLTASNKDRPVQMTGKLIIKNYGL